MADIKLCYSSGMWPPVHIHIKFYLLYNNTTEKDSLGTSRPCLTVFCRYVQASRVTWLGKRPYSRMACKPARNWESSEMSHCLIQLPHFIFPASSDCSTSSSNTDEDKIYSQIYIKHKHWNIVKVQVFPPKPLFYSSAQEYASTIMLLVYLVLL